jgi:hypothetical protein
MRKFSRPEISPGRNDVLRTVTVGALAVCLCLSGTVDTAQATNLQQLIEQVGSEYGEAYSSPFIHAFGPNQNSNLYSTANIPWSGLTFGVGIKVMATNINEEDQTFQKVVQVDDLGVLDPALAGRSGTAVMSGPTIFGDENTSGKVDVYSSGIFLGSIEGIPGFWDTRWVPMFTPEVSIGGIVGLKATVRYFPSMKLGDIGNSEYLGYGLQWSASGLLEDLPVDLMIGFFTQGLDVENTQGLGEDKLIESNANSYFLAVSKSWPAMTIYGGFAIESSDMKVAYYFEDPDFPDLAQNVSFSVDGRQDQRFTIGINLDILLNLNIEAGFGDMTTYSAGLMFGF